MCFGKNNAFCDDKEDKGIGSSPSIMSTLFTKAAEEGLFKLQTEDFQVHLLVGFLQPRQCELKPFCDAFG